MDSYDPLLKRNKRYSGLSIDDDILSYLPETGSVYATGTYISDRPLNCDTNYFEIEIVDMGIGSAITIGAATDSHPLDKCPGYVPNSIGYCIKDGKLYKGVQEQGIVFGPKCETGDRVGCGVKFDQITMEDTHNPLIPLFFTKNGKEFGTALAQWPSDEYYPTVSLNSVGEEVRLNLNARWPADDGYHMFVDNHEEDWARLYDVRLNGQILEYRGCGKTVIDVGLAQAARPLNTTNHYFETEIVDPGESCYIAIGLARNDYPKNMHPGWNRGSIAYHADDGKIFEGSGVGHAFGPRCHKGDVMGCGIIFTELLQASVADDTLSGLNDCTKDRFDHSNCDTEISDVMNRTPVISPISPFEFSCPGDRLLTRMKSEEETSESESEDKPIYSRRRKNSFGCKVQVFFTRNGKTLGKRDAMIPPGGFFPTIGMLSCEEKVRVDLRPLSG